MKNPLNRRIFREFKGEAGKNLVIFLFITMMVSLVSGFLVSNHSMQLTYDESFDKYNIEDGNFELFAKADQNLTAEIEKSKVQLFENFYKEEETADGRNTIRIFKNRTEVDKICLMEGELPAKDNEIAIDRMYADNNKLSVGDRLSAGGRKYTISGLVAFSDYSALFSSPNDMMFDATRFSVAVVTDKEFDSIADTHIHYSYSWKYSSSPADDTKAKEMSDDLLGELAEKSAAAGNAVTNFIPQYSNQAIHFTGNDMGNDKTMFTAFLYIVIVIIAFIIAITTSNTITKEANVIGTLRATGYSRGELIRHYIASPVIVMLAAAIVGNILGYTLMKNYMAGLYYGSYSLPTYITRFSSEAFLLTTVIPLIIMFCINLFVLVRKMSLSPLKFLRRDLARHQRKKAFKLNTKIPIQRRFRIRIIFQNIPNYITLFIGILFANIILLFGLVFTPMLDNYKDDIVENMISKYQYVLKTQAETSTDGAEKYCAGGLKIEPLGYLPGESATVYGVAENSKFIDIDFVENEVAISSAYAEKYELNVGDSITLKEEYGDKDYTFKVSETYYYPSAVAIFMPQKYFNSTFDYDNDYFNGYFSNKEITDLDENLIATSITQDDMTKTTRQLEVSMGEMMYLMDIFSVIMFMLMIFLLSKIIIEKNTQSISMTKILGYSNKEINSLYIKSTTIVVIASIIITIPICNILMKYLFKVVMSQYPGWIPYQAPFSTLGLMAIMGICAYAIVAFLLMKKIKRVNLGEALKNAE